MTAAVMQYPPGVLAPEPTRPTTENGKTLISEPGLIESWSFYLCHQMQQGFLRELFVAKFASEEAFAHHDDAPGQV